MRGLFDTQEGTAGPAEKLLNIRRALAPQTRQAADSHQRREH